MCVLSRPLQFYRIPIITINTTLLLHIHYTVDTLWPSVLATIMSRTYQNMYINLIWNYEISKYTLQISHPSKLFHFWQRSKCTRERFLATGEATSFIFSEYYLQCTKHKHMVDTLTKFQSTRYFLYVDDILIIYN
jgi:hypothetical protein